MSSNSDKLYKAYLGELKEQVCLQVERRRGNHRRRRPLQLSYLKTYARVCDRSCRPVFLFSDDLFDEGTQTFCCSWMFERTRVSYGQLHENDGRRWAALFHKSWCLYGSCTMVRDRCASLTCRPCNIQGDFSICPKGHQPSGKCLNKSLE